MAFSSRLAAWRPTCYRLGVKFVAAVALAIYLPVVCAASNKGWVLVRSPHFEVYSQAGERDGRSALLWFEQLRAFFIQAGVAPPGDLENVRDAEGRRSTENNSHVLREVLESRGPVRVIGFRSVKEYAAFRLRPAADAYFVGGEAADYIVMPRLGQEEFGVAAHEYAHLLLHSLGLRLPAWLGEGIAELFSTVRVSEKGCVIGGDLPMRTLALRRRPWIPLTELLVLTEDSPMRANRQQADTFYAESWALTSMLAFSPAYAPRFHKLFDSVASGRSEARTITRIYGKAPDSVMRDLRTWVERPGSGVPLPGIPSINQHVEVSELTSFESRLMIADLLLASGDLDRAEATYKALAEERPDDPAIAAALGTIALRKGDPRRAREQWKLAIHFGIRDATLFYRYATLADDAGLPANEIAAPLRRAVELKADFDDARYKLGLLESNSGHYEAALEQFRAMRMVPAGRAYAYWTAVATAFTETDQREEAKEAAGKAMRYATSAEERASASRLAYIAQTDLTVQFSHDANGKLQMITARKPHGESDWNPFIEPGDHIRYVEGKIEKVECNAGKITGFRVAGASTAVEVAVPDPAHILIRGGTPEFVCGAEDGRKVAIQYAAFDKRTAADGVLRGMQFR